MRNAVIVLGLLVLIVTAAIFANRHQGTTPVSHKPRANARAPLPVRSDSADVYAARAHREREQRDSLKRANEVAAEEEREERLKEALKQVRQKVDEFEGTTWIYAKTSPQYASSKGLYLYLGRQGVSTPWLRLRIQYAAENWLFVRSFKLNMDGEMFSIDPGNFQIERDHSGGHVWEWLDVEPTLAQVEALKECSDATEATLRYLGDKYHADKKITAAEKQAIKDVLAVYYGLGGRDADLRK